jgi:chitodextrinase
MRSVRIAVVLCALATLVVATPALAATRLPTPATPVASGVTTTSVTLSWSAPAGPVAGYTIQVIDGYVPWHFLASTTATTFTHTGLTPDTVYIYRVIAEPVAGSGYSFSDPSGHLYVTTEPLPDANPPTTPGTPFSTQISTIAATIHFGASTDNRRVAGYWVQRQVDGVWTDWETNNVNTVYLRSLTPDTSYAVVVVAFDANRNRSARSAPFTFTTRRLAPEPACRAKLTPFGQQYLLDVTVENMTAATVLQNWTVTFQLPAAHTVLYSFNATISRSGDTATATPAIWYTTLNPGGTATFGANASYPAGSPLPSGFRLVGGAGTIVSCS